MNVEAWPNRVSRALDMHPTPIEIRSAIFDAIFEHDRAADPSDRFPISAHRVIREAIRKCTEDHQAKTHNVWPEKNHAR